MLKQMHEYYISGLLYAYLLGRSFLILVIEKTLLHKNFSFVVFDIMRTEDFSITLF